VNLPSAMQDLFGGGVRRPVAKEALALGKRSRVGKAQAQDGCTCTVICKGIDVYHL